MTIGGGGGGDSGGTSGGGLSSGSGANGEVKISWTGSNSPLLTPVAVFCNCGCPNEPGSLLRVNPASAGPIIPPVSPDPVRYADGVATIAATDLHSSGFGFDWGQTRTWSNGAGYAAGTANGSGWVDTYIPHLIQSDGSTNNSMIFIANGDTASYYNLVNGVYQPLLDDASKLTYNSGNDTFTLIDTLGDQIVLNGFGTTRPAAQRGEFASYTDPYGTQMAVTSYTSDGHIAEMQRSDTSGSNTTTESWLYSYLPSGNANAGLMSNVTLRTKVNSGAWSIERQVNYAYYDGTQQYGGSVGDLMTATVEDGSNNVLSTSYYRYYKSGDANGYTHGLKYVFNPDSYERLTAALGTNLASLTDAQVAPYADNYFQYNSAQQVSQETVQGAGDSQTGGGLGTYTYSYTNSSNPQGTNSWFTKTVVTNPDTSTDTVYTNAFAEVMLDDHYDPSSGLHTDHFYEYNSQGQLTLDAAPSAITGYSDSSANLSPALNNTSGLITIYTYDTTTTATETQAGLVAGYLDEEFLQQGQQGSYVRQEAWGYFAHSYNGQTIAPLASDEFWRTSDINSGMPTNYLYTWYSGTAQIQSEKDVAPVISTAENGPGVADTTTTYFDQYGNVQWVKDPDGYIQYNAYDPVTGALLTNIVDVQTADSGEFTNLPSGWTTPSGGGLNLITTDVVDALGRTTKETSPNGNVTYYVYLDPQHEERIYQGWNSSTGTATEPTEVIREDATDGYDEVFTMTATPHLTNSAPDGTEAISGLQTLTRDYTNKAGQVTAEYAYFNLGSLTNSTSTMGTVNTNYYQTNYGYDNWGRLVRTQTPNGTIYRTVYNSLDEAVSAWVGTNDTPTSGEWSPTNNTGTANMVEVRSYQYDNGGVGDGNLTQVTAYPGLGAANRVTDFWYDWRDRLVAQKSGVQASENDGTNRPIIVNTYDNLDEVTQTQQYTGDGVTPTISNGVLSPLAANSLRAQENISYDDQGRVYQTQVYKVDPTNGTLSSTALTTNDYYDHRGDLIAESAPGGLWTKSQYDGAGRDVMDYTTDGAGGTTWAAAGSAANDTVLEQRQTVYDSDSNVIETIDSQRFHNATGTGALGSPTSGIGARVYYTADYYDNADRLTASVDVGTNGGTAWTRPSTAPASSATVLVSTYAYNSMGLVQDVTDPQGIDTRTLYDNLGRVTESIQDYTGGTPGNENDVATEYGYDGNNHVTSLQADQPGTSHQKTAYVYGVTTAGGSGVNSNDILSAVQPPDPTTGNPSSTQQDSYLVNALGQTVQSTDRNGNVHQNSYDVLGRLTSDAVTTLGTGVDGSVRRIQYAYDSQGNLSLVTAYNAASGGSIVNQVQDVFNGLRQLTGEYQAHSGAVVQGTTPEVQYAYTEMSGSQNNSRLVSMTYPKGYVLNYNYNTGLDSNISRLSSISDSGGTVESYKYLGLDTVVERDHPQNNINLTYIKQGSDPNANGDGGDQYTGLDRFGRVIDQNWVNASGISTDRFQYGYNQDSDALYKQNLVDAAMSELYQYDNLHQITNFQRGTLNSTHNRIVGTPSASQSWSSDALGNFTSVTTNSNTQTRTANQQNEITSISGQSAPTYDANGNLTADGNGNTYVYNAWNRLVTVKNNGTTIATYSYDGLGRRITQTEGGTTTDLYYSAADQVLEEDVGGVIQARNVWSPVYVNALVLRDQSSQHNGTLDQRLYVQQDANWNVTALVDTSGNVVERYDYMPYSAVTVLNPDFSVRGSSSYAMPYLWQGERYDATTGLYRIGVRDVSPVLMRPLQTDPLGLEPDDNWYRWEGDRPTDAVDPSGLRIFGGSSDSWRPPSWLSNGLHNISKGFMEVPLVVFDLGQATTAGIYMGVTGKAYMPNWQSMTANGANTAYDQQGSAGVQQLAKQHWIETGKNLASGGARPVCNALSSLYYDNDPTQLEYMIGNMIFMQGIGYGPINFGPPVPGGVVVSGNGTMSISLVAGGTLTVSGEGTIGAIAGGGIVSMAGGSTGEGNPPQNLWRQVEQAIQDEWASRGDLTSDAMSLESLEGPYEVANPDPLLGEAPNQVRYQATVVNEATGETINVSIGFDPATGRFGTIKPSSIQPGR
jgi:RHS repeat-associated protein